MSTICTTELASVKINTHKLIAQTWFRAGYVSTICTIELASVKINCRLAMEVALIRGTYVWVIHQGGGLYVIYSTEAAGID